MLKAFTLGMGICVGLWLATPALFAESVSLDGKTFVGQVCPKGKKTGDPDTFTFSDGQFDSEACHAYGFGSAAYTAKKKDGAVAFEAQTKSARGTIDWNGTVKNDKVEGTMVFHRKKTWYNFFLRATEENVFEATLKE